MPSVLGILTILSALAATGRALSCVECKDSSTTCSGSSVTCAPGLVCGSTYGETIIGGQTFKNVLRSCAPTNECSLKGNIDLSPSKIRMVTTCCETDNCTPEGPEYVPISSQPNGVECPFCVNILSSTCQSSATIKCTGQENRCLHATAETTGVGGILQGCTTESFCGLGSGSVNIGETAVKVKFECSGGRSVQMGVLTAAVVCLLLLTWPL
ncbi:phospholipase A2 inhibitor and Ly6/PLAUR domain-containing protein-like [Dendropsophus ebraccatus]|uniref:phospholipase A2 inhibitor and Ly6/PLAUR domain-containing protein-like n=1 Tax=Dendropsophus ebraccatus TaxID=150705 RepID=UPI0038322F39